jgi:hypothetical protein
MSYFVQPRAHKRPCEGRRRCVRNRAAEPSSSPGALPLSRLRRRPSCSRRCGRATGNHPRQPNRRLAHLERNQSVQIATTLSLYFTSLPRTSFRLGALASGQVSAHVRPHVRTQTNTLACHLGARRHGQATDKPARSSEDMDAAFGRPMLTHAREGQGLTFLWPDLV